MTYYRLGVFGSFVVEEAVHNLAGRRIYNLKIMSLMSLMMILLVLYVVMMTLA